MVTRKNFIKQTGVITASVLMNQLRGFGFNKTINSGINVTYFEKGHTRYEVLRKGFNKRINNFPQIIALCKNTKGVQEAVTLAKEKNIKFTIKSGGHCMEGFSCLQDGMVINLSLFDDIQLNNDNTAWIEPACRLKKIYETILPKGKYLPGGSCQTVAIGGLTLGGGYGLLSRTYGLTCDSLLEAEMVTTEGNIVTTQNNDELLWSLKGGNNGNFGIVTKLKFKLHVAPKTMQSYKFRHQNVNKAKAIEICKKWFEETRKLPNSCFSAFIYNGKTTYILLTNTQTNTPTVNQFINTFKALSNKFTQGLPLPLSKALAQYYAEANPITFKNASAGLYKGYEDIETILPSVFDLIKSRRGILYQINTLGGAIQNEVFEKTSSFPHRAFPYFSELQAYWESNSLNNQFLNVFKKIQDTFLDHGIKAQYRNYPDINFNDWGNYYYAQNFERLTKIKKQYDPNNRMGGEQTL